ncbi:MAG: glutamate racemase [Actinobacteria bacterium]|nr:glutamate racemase [Actinomycetota bacterium]|tara:strand:- start:63262 stop:64071 length:810 start_codon:yes stop_codon:yes gene_type:complete
MPSNQPIGIFDSGFGGLTVARAIIDLLPCEDVVYFGDTSRYPYGPQPLEKIRSYSNQISDYLIKEYDVKMIVIACNTASAAAEDNLRQSTNIPIVGVIEPGAQAVVEVSKTKKIGVIGTVGTINSQAYDNAIEGIGAKDIELVSVACPGFVEFVERGEYAGEQVRILTDRLLAPVIESNVDALLLGCTHYPYLARAIGASVGEDVVLVSSADETAFAVAKSLSEKDLKTTNINQGNRTFISSGDVSWFAEQGQKLFGPELEKATSHNWS